MRPEISEFSFDYAFTEEVVRKFDEILVEAPFFPSLIQEGQGLGFDAGLNFGVGVFLFIQFKLCDRMVSDRAREAKAGIFTPPYYRFELRSRKYSNQHLSLLKLEELGFPVYYVAPVFYKTDDLNTHYANKKIIENSAYIPPSQIGEINDFSNHHVSFKEPNGVGYFLSDPSSIGNIRSNLSFRRDISLAMKKRDVNGLDTNSQLRLLSDMIQILSQTNLYFTEDFRVFSVNDDLRPIQRVAYLARIFFGCETFTVRSGAS